MDFFYKTYLRHLNLFKDKDHFCTWEKWEYVQTDILQSESKRLQKCGDHHDVIKVSLSLYKQSPEVWHGMNIPKRQIFFLSWIMCSVHSKALQLLCK